MKNVNEMKKYFQHLLTGNLTNCYKIIDDIIIKVDDDVYMQIVVDLNERDWNIFDEMYDEMYSDFIKTIRYLVYRIKIKSLINYCDNDLDYIRFAMKLKLSHEYRMNVKKLLRHSK